MRRKSFYFSPFTFFIDLPSFHKQTFNFVVQNFMIVGEFPQSLIKSIITEKGKELYFQLLVISKQIIFTI